MKSLVNLISGTHLLCCQTRHVQTFPNSVSDQQHTRDEKEISVFFKPVEKIETGDIVIGINHNRYQVEQCSTYIYNGPIITIHHSVSDIIDYFQPNTLILAKRRVQSMSKCGGWSSIPSGHFQRARGLRKRMTPPEWKLWETLSNNGLGVKFRAQHPIGPYIVDFYARQASLIIEVDGEIAHGTPEQKADDLSRDSWLRSLGLKVLRYTARDIVTNVEGVTTDISFHLYEKILAEIPQAQWLFSQNITSDDVVYLTDELTHTQVVNLGMIHFHSHWHKVIFNSSANIITKTLILQGYS